MATIVKQWSNGGALTIDYTGEGDGTAVFTSDINEGVDRETTVKFLVATGEVRVERKVKQEGKREVFGCTDGVFMLAEGETFNVLKNGLQ